MWEDETRNPPTHPPRPSPPRTSICTGSARQRARGGGLSLMTTQSWPLFSHSQIDVIDFHVRSTTILRGGDHALSTQQCLHLCLYTVTALCGVQAFNFCFFLYSCLRQGINYKTIRVLASWNTGLTKANSLSYCYSQVNSFARFYTHRWYTQSNETGDETKSKRIKADQDTRTQSKVNNVYS